MKLSRSIVAPSLIIASFTFLLISCSGGSESAAGRADPVGNEYFEKRVAEFGIEELPNPDETHTVELDIMFLGKGGHMSVPTEFQSEGSHLISPSSASAFVGASHWNADNIVKLFESKLDEFLEVKSKLASETEPSLPSPRVIRSNDYIGFAITQFLADNIEGVYDLYYWLFSNGLLVQIRCEIYADPFQRDHDSFDKLASAVLKSPVLEQARLEARK